MGQSKEQFMEVRIRAEMNEEVLKEIPQHLRDEMDLKAVEVVNFKEHYRADAEWKLLNKQFIDTLKARQAREEEIRTNLRAEK